MRVFRRRRARRAAYQLLLAWNEFVEQDQRRRAGYQYVRANHNGNVTIRLRGVTR